MVQGCPLYPQGWEVADPCKSRWSRRGPRLQLARGPSRRDVVGGRELVQPGIHRAVLPEASGSVAVPDLGDVLVFPFLYRLLTSTTFFVGVREPPLGAWHHLGQKGHSQT